MRNRIRKIHGDIKGSAAVEFAMVAPILLIVLFAVIQLGMVLYAKNGLQQAVNAGARYATIYPRPSEVEIREKVLSGHYGLDPSRVEAPNLSYGTRYAAPYVQIEMSYQYDVGLGLFSLSPVTLSHRRIAYLAPEEQN